MENGKVSEQTKEAWEPLTASRILPLVKQSNEKTTLLPSVNPQNKMSFRSSSGNRSPGNIDRESPAKPKKKVNIESSFGHIG
ncbi:hypothetical protein K469DRAFT_698589 [Zopfia rhizophila CBS 207.26]|uniref:Uncharacterized protein n=1 Tax=Zopfia rhizophila CBS 207.26 TaxID=1314779 RepID=A0A6A6EUR3_9PEZI|nr:hypothetical protein K469DRAFT_698589 [Zopfia rhizophila CBS 207.26]